MRNRKSYIKTPDLMSVIKTPDSTPVTPFSIPSTNFEEGFHLSPMNSFAIEFDAACKIQNDGKVREALIKFYELECNTSERQRKRLTRIGRCQQELGEYNDALNTFDDLYDLIENHTEKNRIQHEYLTDVLLFKAICLQKAKNYGEALKTFNNLYSRCTKNTQQHFQIILSNARCFQANSDFLNARELLQKLEKLTYNRNIVYYSQSVMSMSHIWQEMGDHSENLHVKKHRYELAIKHLEKNNITDKNIKIKMEQIKKHCKIKLANVDKGLQAGEVPLPVAHPVAIDTSLPLKQQPYIYQHQQQLYMPGYTSSRLKVLPMTMDHSSTLALSSNAGMVRNIF